METLYFSPCGSSQAWPRVGGAAGERHKLSVGKGAEAGDSRASERGFELSYLVPANSPCSEGEGLRWGGRDWRISWFC